MRYLLRVINWFADTWLAWFTPLWRRRGHEAASLVSRYMHHYGPELPPGRLSEMQRMLSRLREAMLYWRKDELQSLVKEVDETYAAQLPSFRRNAWAEIVESLFVITVVFLGIRTYYVQPFRIPTNSMWPSLNGIVVHAEEAEFPSLPGRVWDAITLGSSYVDVKADRDKTLDLSQIYDERSWLLFTKTVLVFSDGSRVSIPAASGAVIQYLREHARQARTLSGVKFVFKAGDTIMRARVDAGDMVLVNRVAYHFRHPRRGETFVFDTRGLKTKSSSSMNDQSEGTHYIKRLCGVPGDSIRIDSPNLIINGEVAQEPGIARVEAARPPYNATGYEALSPYSSFRPYLTRGKTITLSEATAQSPWLREYLALGDNTENSLDSRYWGPVRQFNILGPASFTLWPFTWHWGAID